MKTRRIVLCILALLTLSFLFAACAPTGDAGRGENFSLSDETQKVTLSDTQWKIVYNNDKVNETKVVRDFNDELNAKTGRAYERAAYDGSAYVYSIAVGTLEGYAGYAKEKERVSEFASDTLGAFSITFADNVVLIVAYDSASLKAGCAFFVENYCTADADIAVPTELSQCILFNKAAYFETGELVAIDSTEMFSDATLASLTVDGQVIDGFSGEKKEYTVNDVPYATRYPTVGATPVFSGATVSVTQASDETDGVATVRVTGRDPKADGEHKTETYTVKFVLDETSESSAEIVWRGGAAGVVTFVIDDGDHATADFVREEMMHKYAALRVSYALITKHLADIQTTADGSAYEMTEDGKYTYTVKQSEVDFWRSHLAANNYCELLSHSWTHDKWGKTDEGGEQELTDYDGKPEEMKVFPKGQITMELAASKQILVELFSQSARYFVKPGTGMKEYDDYLSLLRGGTIYSAARSVEKALNDYKNFTESFSMINSWMVAATDDPEDWNAYIDSAVEAGQWATFCIHRIVVDNLNATGHYIYQKNADVMFSHANTLSAEGKLWIATMTEATDYARLRAASTVKAETFRDDRVDVTLTAGEVKSKLEGGESFDGISLTVKVAVPTSWSGTVVASNGASAEVQTDATGNYVYIDIIPSDATVSLTLAD